MNGNLRSKSIEVLVSYDLIFEYSNAAHRSLTIADLRRLNAVCNGMMLSLDNLKAVNARPYPEGNVFPFTPCELDTFGQLHR